MLSAASRSIGRRHCRPWAAAASSLKENSTAAAERRTVVTTPYTASSIPTVIASPTSRALSTISFDAAAYFSNSPSTPSSSAVVTANNNLAATTSSAAIEHQQSRQQAEEQMKQWIENNPLIAPYKAEECLAKLWVVQQEIFDEWAASSSLPPPPILITNDTVNLCIKAWCHSKKGEIAAERAERLLNWMENLHATTSSSPFASLLPQPNYQSYALAIDAWSQAAVIESSKGGSATAATTTIHTNNNNSKAIPDATNVGFNCAKRAEDLLMLMQAKHEELQRLSETNRDYPYNSELQPDTNVFNKVLMGWSHIRGGTKASAIRAMRILDLMQELHHHQSSDAPSWQGIGLSKVQPNLHTYKCVIYAWGHASHTLEGPDRAEEILRHMLSISKAGNNLDKEVLPDEECFRIVMKAHAELVRRRGKGDISNAERARQVTDLLNWMELLALRRTKPKIEPTTESYRIALSAWAWSHHIDAPKQCEEILFRMIRACELNRNKIRDIEKGLGSKDSVTLAVTPETKDFNTVINCCSFARGVGLPKDELDDDIKLNQQLALKETYDIAEGVLDALLSFPYAQPDSATFAGMIRACVNLLPDTDERDVRVIDIFRLAYQSPNVAVKSSVIPERLQAPAGGGCVDANVLRQLRHALPTEEYIRVREEFEEHRRKNSR